ncbi:MAG: hypothetical protein R3C15_03600 [Thermoleophilia bacterium]
MTLVGSAYGLRIDGPLPPGQLNADLPGDWPVLRIEVEPGDVERPETTELDERLARMPLLSGGLLELTRDPLAARFRGGRPLTPDELVHPGLAGVGAIASIWLGRESIHAGAFLVGGRAWAVTAEKETGKSTTMAALARRGLPIVTDDVLVLDGGDALAGPRSVDLREGAARWLGIDPIASAARSGERARVQLEPVPSRAPLAGWIFLDWGDEVAVEPVRPTRRAALLLRQRTMQRELSRASGLLDLAALPAVRLVRPRDLARLDEALDALLARVG